MAAHAPVPSETLAGTLTDAVSGAVTAVKPKLRGVLHGITFPIAVAAGIVLIVLADGGRPRTAAVVYGVSTWLLFGVSATYHRGRWGPRVAGALKRFDHANIYLVIAGSYIPFALLALHGTTATVVLWIECTGAAAGILFRVFWVGAPRWLYTALYLLLGWVAAFVFPDLLRSAGVAAVVLLIVGGALYSLGGVVYGLKRPNPSPRWFGFHEVFHALTIAAFITQYIAISFVTYRA